MRFVDLVSQRPLIWGLFIAYMVATSALAWLGHKKTKDIRSFAVGSGAMNPVVVGITLAASIASTATFVINPGFVYVHGVSALAHLGVAAGLGVILGLCTMSFGFRRFGARGGAITLPGWIGDRYRSTGLRTLFAAVNLLSVCFVVLILGGLSIVMQQTLGLTNVESLLLVVIFVFGYVFVGGATAHAYTNTLQGVLMALVAVLIVASGRGLLGGDTLGRLSAIDPNLARTVNPASPLFGSFFSVWVSGFVVGFALVCQPHILTKALYVDSDQAVRRYLGVTVAVSLAFSALLLVGIYARLMGLGPEAFRDASGAFRQDLVMAVYLGKTFGPVSLAVITVALLAAGMSTLDGILVALSSIAGHDLYLPIADRLGLVAPEGDARAHSAHRASQLVLVAIGAGAFVIALDPPRLLGIFGQVGVYGIVAASAVPVALGVFLDAAGRSAAIASAGVGLAVHFGLYLGARWLGASPSLELGNPAVTATWALLASAATGLGLVALARLPGGQPSRVPSTDLSSTDQGSSLG